MKKQKNINLAKMGGLWAVALAFFLLEGRALAKEEHAHKAPHGGQVATAGEYHLELLSDNEGITVYLLDKAEKTLPVKEVTGKALLVLADKTRQTVELAPKDDAMRGSIDLKDVSHFAGTVTFKIGDKSVTAKFKHHREKDRGPAEHHSKEEKPEHEGHHGNH